MRMIKAAALLIMMGVMAGGLTSQAQAQGYSASYKFLEAVKEKNYTDIKKAIEKGVNINTRDYDTGETPLIIAVKQKNESLVNYLLDSGAKPNIAASNGETALIIAAGNRNKTISALLLHHKADMDLADKNGETALIRAIISNNRKVVELLLDIGADYTIEDYSGRTALMHAQERRRRGLVKMLKEKGATY